MTQSVHRPVAAAFVAAALAVLVASTTLEAQAGEDCAGTWVVVDATGLDGEVTRRCAEGEVGTGVEALERAGHESTFVPRIPGMICTIDRQPDPCNQAPSDAYWSYWHAGPDDTTWTYSSLGAGNRTPVPGGAEGWRFGDGSEPPQRAPQVTSSEQVDDDPAAGDDAPTSTAGATGPVTGAAVAMVLLAIITAATWRRRRQEASP